MVPSASCSATSTRCSAPTSACSSVACSWSTTPPSCRGRSPSSTSGGTRQMPAGLDLRDARARQRDAHQGASSPRVVFDFGYESRDLELDLRYEGVIAPMVTDADTAVQQGPPRPNRSRHRQHDAARRGDRGRLLRDARPAWGPRQDGRQPEGRVRVRHRVADHAFLAISIDQQGEDLVVGVPAARRRMEPRGRGGARGGARRARPPDADHRRRHRRARAARCTRSAAW